MAFGDILGGVGAGALSGATAGSAFGAVGAGVGAGLGGLLGGFGARGKGSKEGQFMSTLSPEQQSLFSQLLGQFKGEYSGQNQEQFEAPYLRQFNEQTIPGLAEQFSGLGAGSQSSSAFRQSLGAAGAGLSEQLASIGANKKENALQSLLQLLNLNTQAYMPGSMSGLQQFLVGAAPGVGQALGNAGVNSLSNLFNRTPGQSNSPYKNGTFSSLRPNSYGELFNS